MVLERRWPRLSSLSAGTCLLASISCVTPFPLEKLEEGMTKIEVRQAVGEPDEIYSREIWIYPHDERFGLVFWNDWEVLLRFENEILSRWILRDAKGGTHRPRED